MPDTTPNPLAAYLTAAKRDLDRLRGLGETLLPESSPVKTAENPAPVVWVPVAWDAIRPGMLVRGTRTGYRVELTVGRIDGSVVHGVGGGTWLRTLNDETATWEVDPRTVPAEPDDPGVQLLLDWYASKVTPTGADAALLLARIDAARADQ